ncbi:MAG: FxsA family protein [Candidatus Thiodiazotropha endolucinida]
MGLAPRVSSPVMNPLLLFLLLFVGVPLVELYFLIEVGSQIGAFSTIFLTVFTALLGGWMVRTQGFSTLSKVRGSMDRGEVPAFEMMEGAVLLVCGFLLLLPGFITDVVGFVFLVPPVRRWLITLGLQQGGVMGPAGPPPNVSNRSQERRVIEGEFKREDDE